MSAGVRALRMGWEAGRRRGEASAAESWRLLRGLLKRTPTQDEVGSFGNGSVDGSRGDRWRLDQMGADR